jgi:hypothetical protein
MSAIARNQMKNWEVIADNLSKAGWGCVSAIDEAAFHQDRSKLVKNLSLRGEPCLHRRRLLLSKNKPGTHP